MSYESKPSNPPEKSLGYMAWSMKDIAAELKKISALLEQILQAKNSPAQVEKQGDFPF